MYCILCSHDYLYALILCPIPKTQCPIPKTQNKLPVENYRPISLLCISGKVLERIVYNKIIDFIRPKLSKHQFGFLRNRSCLSQLLTTFATVFEEIDNGAVVDIVYLDFKKAFDTVPHDELLLKLWKIGITGQLWHWFRAYLSDRQHYVKIGNISSSYLPVLSGVPQGSILGPLLFLIYINDLPEQIDYSSCLLFADDTKLLGTIRTESDCIELQKDLDALDNWCKLWRLKLNASKCTTLKLSLAHSSHHRQYQYCIDGTVIPYQEKQRDLGIIVKNDLSWTEHYNIICRKAYQSLNLIRRTFKQTMTTQVKRCLYLTLVRSHLAYCSQIWRPRLVKDTLNLERIQRKATKYILNNYVVDYKVRLNELHLLPLMYWLELLDVMFLVRCLQNPSDNLELPKYITFTSSITRAGQSGNKLQFKFTRTSTVRHFYFNRVIKLWNSFPSGTIDLTLSFVTIKHHVRKHLWSVFQQKFDVSDYCSFYFVCPCHKCSGI